MLYDMKWDAIPLATDAFLPAHKLGVPEKARAALIAVLGMMECGEIQHVQKSTYTAIMPRHHLSGLYMGHVFSRHECGTAGCLLGWARWVTQDLFLLTGARTPELDDLFCMGNYQGKKLIDDLSSADVAPALRSWLTTGKVVWPD